MNLSFRIMSTANTPSPIPSPAHANFTACRSSSVATQFPRTGPIKKGIKYASQYITRLTATACFLATNSVIGQTFTTLHNFTIASNSTNTDGAHPYAGVVQSGGKLYGTTPVGGDFGLGTLFALNTDGTAFTTLHEFAGADDGAQPYGEPIVNADMVYGMTTADCPSPAGHGTIFAMKTNGTGFTTLHTFTEPDQGSASNIRISGSTLYSCLPGGHGCIADPDVSYGSVFAMNTDGTDYQYLHVFTSNANPPYYTNADGSFPVGFALSADGIIYGTAGGGGRLAHGTIFRLGTNGDGFTVLHDLDSTSSGYGLGYGLVLSGKTLYWAAEEGSGSLQSGVLLALNTDGTDFRTLYNFPPAFGFPSTNSTGLLPGRFVVSGDTLFGVASQGGISGNGTIFAVKTDGTTFSTLYSFTSTSTNASGIYTNNDGAYPMGLTIIGNTLYGTTLSGGTGGSGTIFSLSLPASLTITAVGTNVILTWPSNYSGYTLQSTANIAPAGTWTAVSPTPIILNGQYTVTNPISGARKFYRLSQ